MSKPTIPALLELSHVSKRFVQPLGPIAKAARLLGANVREQTVHAVDDVSLSIDAGEVLGLVGESGSGKSTLGRMAVGLHSLSAGMRLWKGREVGDLASRGPKRQPLGLQMIFQDPYASLNPRLRVQDIIGEAPVAHGLIPRGEQKEYVEQLLRRVGLDPAVARHFPHQFSGGQRARVGIARALAVKPEFVVCDEAVAALDVSIQAQVLNLFMQLREELRLTYLFISHDLGVVRHMSDRVAVMYLGRVLELMPTPQLFAAPNHPYTQALLAEAPRLGAGKQRFIPIRGEIPSPLDPPSGCHFHPRCPHAMARCRVETPPLQEVAPSHYSACHLNDTPAG